MSSTGIVAIFIPVVLALAVQTGSARARLMMPLSVAALIKRPDADRPKARRYTLRGENGLQVYVMCEIPSNVILAPAFARRFDGFSIGSNDLTQLTLGVDRDSAELEDYPNVLAPAVEAALKQHDKVCVYYQIDADFAGIGPDAIWRDYKVGVGHWLRWERIAVVTDVEWIRPSVRAFSFLMPGAVMVFALADADKVREWIVAADAR